jgi:hypothetical protein
MTCHSLLTLTAKFNTGFSSHDTSTQNDLLLFSLSQCHMTHTSIRHLDVALRQQQISKRQTIAQTRHTVQ